MKGIDISQKYLGLHEVKDNKEIKALLHSQSIHGDIAINPAETSWCAAWINFCERSVGNPGNGCLNARSFLTYGTNVSDDDWQGGDIAVFKFPSDSPGHGHVSYIYNWNDDNNTINCLGGNQDNMVRVSTYSQDYIVGVRRFIK